MTRLICLTLVVALASVFPTHAQEKDKPKPFTNSIGMKFVWIPPGSFLMGSPKEEKERDVNETQHKVTLSKGFYMGIYAVTQEEWQPVMDKNPSFFKGEIARRSLRSCGRKTGHRIAFPPRPSGNSAVVPVQPRRFTLGERSQLTRQITMASAPMEAVRKASTERKPHP